MPNIVFTIAKLLETSHILYKHKLSEAATSLEALDPTFPTVDHSARQTDRLRKQNAR